MTESRIIYIKSDDYFPIVMECIKEEEKLWKVLGINREASLAIAGVCSALQQLTYDLLGFIEVHSDREGYAMYIAYEEKTDRLYIHRLAVLFGILPQKREVKVEEYIDGLRKIRDNKLYKIEEAIS